MYQKGYILVSDRKKNSEQFNFLNRTSEQFNFLNKTSEQFNFLNRTSAG